MYITAWPGVNGNYETRNSAEAQKNKYSISKLTSIPPKPDAIGRVKRTAPSYVYNPTFVVCWLPPVTKYPNWSSVICSTLWHMLKMPASLFSFNHHSYLPENHLNLISFLNTLDLLPGILNDLLT